MTPGVAQVHLWLALCPFRYETTLSVAQDGCRMPRLAFKAIISVVNVNKPCRLFKIRLDKLNWNVQAFERGITLTSPAEVSPALLIQDGGVALARSGHSRSKSVLSCAILFLRPFWRRGIESLLRVPLGKQKVVYASFLYLASLSQFMIGKTCGAGSHCDANFRLEFEVVFVVICSRWKKFAWKWIIFFASPCVDRFVRHLPSRGRSVYRLFIGIESGTSMRLDGVLIFGLINQGCVCVAAVLTLGQCNLARGVAGGLLLRLISTPLTTRPSTGSDAKIVYTFTLPLACSRPNSNQPHILLLTQTEQSCCSF